MAKKSSNEPEMKSLSQLRRQLTTRAGLCHRCRYLRPLANPRGSLFVFCEKSKTDPTFPRYPHLPVLLCPGFEEAEEQPGLRR